LKSAISLSCLNQVVFEVFTGLSIRRLMQGASDPKILDSRLECELFVSLMVIEKLKALRHSPATVKSLTSLTPEFVPILVLFSTDENLTADIRADADSCLRQCVPGHLTGPDLCAASLHIFSDSFRVFDIHTILYSLDTIIELSTHRLYQSSTRLILESLKLPLFILGLCMAEAIEKAKQFFRDLKTVAEFRSDLDVMMALESIRVLFEFDM
jgi:hypothetical protein